MVGRQFSDSVRRDCAREVDGLAARATQWDVCDECHGVRIRAPMASYLR